MSEHVSTWLEAYYDGELKERQLRDVEEHIADCLICQNELARIKGLSSLLQSVHGPEGLLNADQFVAQVGLQLPRHSEQPMWEKILFNGWRLVPLGLFGLWSFLQAVFVVAAVVSLAANLGLGGDLFSSLVPERLPQSGQWGVFPLQGTDLEEMLKVVWDYLSIGGPLGWNVMVNLGLFVAIGLLYWSWLASWWVRQQHGETRNRRLVNHTNGSTQF